MRTKLGSTGRWSVNNHRELVHSLSRTHARRWECELGWWWWGGTSAVGTKHSICSQIGVGVGGRDTRLTGRKELTENKADLYEHTQQLGKHSLKQKRADVYFCCLLCGHILSAGRESHHCLTFQQSSVLHSHTHFLIDVLILMQISLDAVFLKKKKKWITGSSKFLSYFSHLSKLKALMLLYLSSYSGSSR